MTTEELLALPDDGVERWLVEGQLREYGTHRRELGRTRVLDKTARKAYAQIVRFLGEWLDKHRRPGRRLICGDTSCGINGDAKTLAVEFACPDDSFAQNSGMIDIHRSAGVPVVWLVRPHDRTITIYRLDAEPELVNVNQELSGDPHLPGFRVAVAEIFA